VTTAPAREVDAELKVVCDILHGDEAALSRFPEGDASAAERFVGFAHHHRVAGFLYRKLLADGLLGCLPEPVTGKLESWYVDQEVIVKDRLDEARALASAFQRAGMDVVFLKGAFLANRYYDDWRDRFTWDTDLFIRGARDLARARKVVLEAGYVEVSRTPFGDRAMRWFTHDVEFDRDGLPLDVHWAFGNHYSFRIDYGRIWEGRRRVELEGAEYSVLQREDELVLTVLGILRDIERGRLRLKSCVDLVRMVSTLDADTDWKRFFRERQAERLDGIVPEILTVALDLLGFRGRFHGLELHLPADRAGPRSAVRRLQWSRYGLRNKAWAFRLYRGGWLPSVGWWLLSQPVRRLTHA